MNRPTDIRIWLLARFLVLLPFLAKLSFEFLGFVPSKFWILVYQHGMHPYVNIGLCLFSGIPLILIALFNAKNLASISIFYRLFIVLVIAALWLQALLQIFFDPTVSSKMTMAAVFFASFMIVLYGWFLPRMLRLDDFLSLVGRTSQVLVLLSLAIWLMNPAVTFKGTRFIGVFKHIPYMVTCATLACTFTLVFLSRPQSVSKRVFEISLWLAGFWSLLLTGTRSATFAVILSVLIYFALLKPRTAKMQFLKFALVITSALAGLLFGHQMYDYGHRLIRGEQALGGRQAQDGVKARIEEIDRGFATFQESPWIGKGLLSKFHAQDSAEIAQYDAMKDPHNIFVSAGVLGGWSFIFLTVWGLVLATIGAFKNLRSAHLERRVLALYVLSQIPILIIYHVHLSLGGLADRLYWLTFGFLALTFHESFRNPNTGVHVKAS